MDSVTGTDSQYSYTLERLAALGFTESPHVQPNNLTRYNRIFSPTRWHERNVPDWIHPTLCLATAMIESPASLAFMHSFLYSPRKYLKDDSERLGVTCYKFRHTKHPQDEVERIGHEHLHELGPYVHFEWFDPLAEENVDLEENSVTSLTKSYPGVEVRMPHNLDAKKGKYNKGRASVISIHKGFHYEFVRLVKQEPYLHAPVLRLQFSLAILLCREVQHALSIAHFGDQKEPFFEDERIADLGHAWVHEVFGGSPTITWDSKKPVTIVKWPTFEAEGSSERRGPKGSCSLYLIAMDYISEIQQRAFWYDKGNDTELLRVNRTLGQRMYQWPFEPQDLDPDWEPDDSSEDERSEDAQGKVERDPEREEQEAIRKSLNKSRLSRMVSSVTNRIWKRRS
ncbi:hypothetical protein MMC12_000146 [Toensbergia leucococca]|nr:hypothetical protein [Toensbergia leucococca]